MIRITNSSKFRSGDWVQVRTKEEILATLDKEGRVEELPFMPEMFEFCGKRFRVFKRAHKTCDPPNGLQGRRMLHAVHLENNYCNGSSHGGCQARCLVFWKDAWLKHVDPEEEGQLVSSAVEVILPTSQVGCTEKTVCGGTRDQDKAESNDVVFVCQSTRISQATQPLQWWDISQYAEDYTSGNVSILRLITTLLHFLYTKLVSAGIGIGSVLRGGYDSIQRLRGGTPYPFRVGKIPLGEKTPSTKLKLRPGELVRIRRYEEILDTLDESAHNRGMYFDAEMVPYCGGTYRVLDRISRIINEKTGRMQVLKNDCIMLEKVVCNACYSKYRRFCPRSIYPYWREIWLERVVPVDNKEEQFAEASRLPRECRDEQKMV